MDRKNTKKTKVPRVTEAELARMTPGERFDLAMKLTYLEMQREAEIKAAGGPRLLDMAAYRARRQGGRKDV